MSTETREATYGIFAPRQRPAPEHETTADSTAASMLGRRWLRWTVYRRSAGQSGMGWERISHHWTRRAAWLASSRLRFADTEATS